MAKSAFKVLIVGSGPAGQLLGLLLAQQKINVIIVEQAAGLDEQPRATHYGPPAMKILNQAGVGNDVRNRGFICDTVSWRKPDGTPIATLNHDTHKNHPDRLTALPLNQLAQILKEHGSKTQSLEYKFNARVISIGQNEKEAWVNIEDVKTSEKSRLTADYVVGCDGANSIIRRSLFGDMNFPGHTWDEQIVATNVYYEFHKFGWNDSNFIIDPENWYMAAKITKDGMWRVTYGEVGGLTRDQLLERQPMKFETMLPGNPKPGQYKLMNISPYKVHQRLAENMRVGRFVLAGDAAHLCNPFGGLGLTGGIADVGSLFECLHGIYLGKLGDDILDKYDEIRRQKYNEIVNPISSSNLKRMYNVDPDQALENDEFLQMCKKAETDKKLAKVMLDSSFALNHDFTQYYA